MIVDEPAEPGLAVADLQWESLNGPPGGGAGIVVQDPYTGTVYTVSPAVSLFQTTDQGESWTEVRDGSLRNVTSLAFSRHGAYTCSSDGLFLIPPEGQNLQVFDVCITVAVDDEWLYATNSFEGLAEPRVEIWRASVGSSPPTQEASEWTDVTPTHDVMANRAQSAGAVLSVDDLVIAGDSVLAAVAMADAPLHREQRCVAGVAFSRSRRFLATDRSRIR